MLREFYKNRSFFDDKFPKQYCLEITDHAELYVDKLCWGDLTKIINPSDKIRFNLFTATIGSSACFDAFKEFPEAKFNEPHPFSYILEFMKEKSIDLYEYKFIVNEWLGVNSAIYNDLCFIFPISKLKEVFKLLRLNKTTIDLISNNQKNIITTDIDGNSKVAIKIKSLAQFYDDLYHIFNDYCSDDMEKHPENWG